MYRTPILSLVLFLLLPACLLAQDGFRDPKDILEIMNKSTVLYEINILKKPIPKPDFQFEINLAEYYRVEQEEGFITEKVELSEEDLERKEVAEKHFQQKEYAAARAIYTELFEKYPNYSKLQTYIGQTHHLEGNNAPARLAYKAAIESNPIDYMAYWFMGNLLWEEGQKEAALKSYLTAHILNRNHPILAQNLEQMLTAMGYNYEPWVFNPQVEVEEYEEGKVRLSADEQWIAYAMAQAVWNYDDDFRKEMGLEDDEYSTVADRDAIGGFYVLNFDNKKMQREPFFKTLRATIEANRLDAYIVYEALLVKDPFLAYQLKEKDLEMIRTYLTEIRFAPTKKSQRAQRKRRR